MCSSRTAVPSDDAAMADDAVLYPPSTAVPELSTSANENDIDEPDANPDALMKYSFLGDRIISDVGIWVKPL